MSRRRARKAQVRTASRAQLSVATATAARAPRPKPVPPSSLARINSWIAIALAVAMLAFRFFDLGLATFVNDEPALQIAAERELRTGVWGTHGLPGTQGATYGPIPLWFYGAVHMVAGPAPRWSIAAEGMLLTASQVWLATALASCFGLGRLALGALLAWIAASPYLFLWSRMAWDNPLANALVCGAVALLARRGPPRGWTALALGLLLGTALGTHLMVVPFAALVLLLVAWEQRHAPRELLLAAGALTLGVVLPNVSYVRFLISTPRWPVPEATLAPGGLMDFLIEPARIATPWRIDYFFDQAWADFRAWLAGLAWVPDLAPFLAVLAAVAALAGLGAALRSTVDARRRVALLGLATWGSYAVFYSMRGLDLHPHYQHPTWWVIPAGVAAGLGMLEGRPRMLAAATAALACLAVLQFAFLLATMRYLGERAGTQGVHYSVPLARLEESMHRACESSGRSLLIENATRVFPHALWYVGGIDPACAGKQIRFCRPGVCPGAPTARLRYAAPVGGALAVEADAESGGRRG